MGKTLSKESQTDGQYVRFDTDIGTKPLYRWILYIKTAGLGEQWEIRCSGSEYKEDKDTVALDAEHHFRVNHSIKTDNKFCLALEEVTIVDKEIQTLRYF